MLTLPTTKSIHTSCTLYVRTVYAYMHGAGLGLDTRKEEPFLDTFFRQTYRQTASNVSNPSSLTNVHFLLLYVFWGSYTLLLLGSYSYCCQMTLGSRENTYYIYYVALEERLLKRKPVFFIISISSTRPKFSLTQNNMTYYIPSTTFLPACIIPMYMYTVLKNLNNHLINYCMMKKCTTTPWNKGTI